MLSNPKIHCGKMSTEKVLHQKCKTCAHDIEPKSAVFHCIVCKESMHMTPKCTGMSAESIFGINSIINNILLLCNDCANQNKKETVLNKLYAPTSMIDQEQEVKKDLDELNAAVKINNLSVQNQLNELKSNLKELMDRPPPPPPEPLFKRANTEKPIENQTRSKSEKFDGIRLRGIPELNTKNSRERYEHDLKEVKAIMKHLKVTCNVTDLKRVGNFSESKTRTLIVKLDSDYSKRLILLSLRKLKDYKIPVFISKELTISEQFIENALLQKRRELIMNGVQPKLLRLRNLVLQQEIDKKMGRDQT